MLNVQPSGLGVSERSAHGTTDAISSTASTTTTARIIEQLIEIAKEMRDADQRGEDTGLSPEELAFYEALEVNDSAVAGLGDEVLKSIARDLVDALKRNVTIDWAVRAKMRVLVKHILRKYGYPPDKQEKATITVVEQAERLSEGWAV